jgi:hypothetical protein
VVRHCIHDPIRRALNKVATADRNRVGATAKTIPDRPMQSAISSPSYPSIFGTRRRLYCTPYLVTAQHRPPDASAELGPVDSFIAGLLLRPVPAGAATQSFAAGLPYGVLKLIDKSNEPRPEARQAAERKVELASGQVVHDFNVGTV